MSVKVFIAVVQNLMAEHGYHRQSVSLYQDMAA